MKIVNHPVDRNAAVLGHCPDSDPRILLSWIFIQNIGWKAKTQDSEVLFNIKEICSFLFWRWLEDSLEDA